jgi:hypothetical protein
VFHVAVQQNGSTEIKDTAHASLAPGASRSEVIHMLRPNCYLPVRVVADTTHVVTVSRGSDNERWAVGIEGTERSTVTQVFPDVDTGDTVSFNASEGCLYLSCTGHEIGAIVDQWGAVPWVGTALTKVGDGLDYILRWAWADDLIGSQT